MSARCDEDKSLLLAVERAVSMQRAVYAYEDTDYLPEAKKSYLIALYVV